MKYVVLSFDDGRRDFYVNAFPILMKYKLVATLNVITDYVGKKNIREFASGNHECITWQNLNECAEMGIEIANHSANHTNDIFQIIKGQNSLAFRLNKKSERIGFASPESEIFSKNFSSYKELVKTGGVAYIRSGNQIKRDGCGYAVLYILSRVTKNPLVFNLYNKRNIIDIISAPKIDDWFYPSVTCSQENSSKQVISFIESIPDNNAAIIMFHSILNKRDPGWGKDKWFNSIDEFEDICNYISNNTDVNAVTNQELHGIIFKNGGK